MLSRLLKYLTVIGAATLLAGALVYAFRPEPVGVDVAAVKRGDLSIWVEEEGVTRIREVYQVSAPVGGKLRRSPREVGDEVKAGETVVAAIEPGDPPFLDVRSRREIIAAVAAARAAIDLAEAQVGRAEAELRFAKADLARAKSLSQNQTISQKAMDEVRMRFDTSTAALASAQATLELRRREFESAQAKLIGPENAGSLASQNGSCCIEIRAPVSGRILKILHESEQVVQAGTPLIEIGDPRDLEITADLLSLDAVNVKAGAEAVVENWGGEGTLRARVRHVEPSGFKKTSALGIEEQRVRTVIDLLDPPEKWQALGHEFRVYVRIFTWSGEDVLIVPLSALFRIGSDWAAFKVEDGQARLVRVKIGRRNMDAAELVSGLEAGDRVILHPSDRVEDGARVFVRSAETLR